MNWSWPGWLKVDIIPGIAVESVHQQKRAVLQAVEEYLFNFLFFR